MATILDTVNIKDEFWHDTATTTFFERYNKADERTNQGQMLGEFSQNVCRIEQLHPSGNLKRSGSGFHWGDGWIVTNSHVLCGIGVDRIPQHLNFKDIRFVFERCGPDYVFDGHDRIGIVLTPWLAG